MFKYDKIRTIHVELTNKCNAGCPLCPRNMFGAMTNPGLILSEISYDNFVDWFDPVIKDIRQWIFCGGYGDPCVSKDIIPIVKYIREQKNGARIHINTNGGMKNKEFWSELGNLFPKEADLGGLIFSIDGLEDTNHLYRQYVGWEKLMENVNAYMSAGGVAVWDYLIFKHNEHQIDEAEKLSKKLGFYKFTPKKALGVEGNKVIPVYNKKGKFTHVLESGTDANKNLGDGIEVTPPPSNIDLKKHIEDSKKNKNKHNEIGPDIINFNSETFNLDEERHKKLNDKTIKCRVLGHKQHGLNKGENSTYITSHGHVVPCCWIGTDMYMSMPTFELTQLKHFFYEYGYNNISLHHNTLKDIYESKYFKKITNSWSVSDIRKGKLAICAVTCGENNALLEIWKHEKNKTSHKWAYDEKH